MNDILKIVKSLQKNYGSLRIAGTDVKDKEYISTGNCGFDLALGGGIAWGYVSEFAGLSGTGKTTILQLMLANAQKKYNAIGIWVDREKAFFNDRAKNLGIDLDRTIVINPENITTVPEVTQFLNDILKDISPDTYKFIAIDSISAFSDTAKIDKSDMGRKAQQLHRLFRTIIPYINNKSSLNFSNQVTFKTGVVFGDPKTVTGGESPKYYSTYRLMLDDKKLIKDDKRGGEIIGNWLQATVIKTRQGPNRRIVVFPHYYSSGVLYYGGYTRLLVDRNYLKPKNAAEFNKFAQTTVIYKDKKFNVDDIETILKEFPELNFSNYPEYNIDNQQIVEDENE